MDAQTDVIKLDLPADNRYLNLVGSCIRAMLDHVQNKKDVESMAYNIELATCEIYTNIVQHAYDGQGGRIQVALSIQGDPIQFVIELQDAGKHFNPDTAPDPDHVLDDIHVHGYGLFLAPQLMDEVNYSLRDNQNCWQLTKKID